MKKQVIDLNEEAKKRERSKPKKEKARSRKKGGRRTKLIVVSVILLCFAMFGSQTYKLIALGMEKSRLESELNDKDAELSRLSAKLEKVNDPARIEELARERFHMLKDGEVLYVFPEEEVDTSQ